MKDVQKELLTISTALSSLVKQVEKMAQAIENGGGKAAPAKKAKAPVKAKARAKKVKAPAKKAKAAPKKTAAKKASPAAAAKAKLPAKGKGPTMLDSIFGMISRSRKGITVERLKKKTGLEDRQVSNALYKLTKKNKIETLSRGVYVKKKK